MNLEPVRTLLLGLERTGKADWLISTVEVAGHVPSLVEEIELLEASVADAREAHAIVADGFDADPSGNTCTGPCSTAARVAIAIRAS